VDPAAAMAGRRDALRDGGGGGGSAGQRTASG
jgi:hypothetical protein